MNRKVIAAVIAAAVSFSAWSFAADRDKPAMVAETISRHYR